MPFIPSGVFPPCDMATSRCASRAPSSPMWIASLAGRSSFPTMRSAPRSSNNGHRSSRTRYFRPCSRISASTFSRRVEAPIAPRSRYCFHMFVTPSTCWAGAQGMASLPAKTLPSPTCTRCRFSSISTGCRKAAISSARRRRWTPILRNTRSGRASRARRRRRWGHRDGLLGTEGAHERRYGVADIGADLFRGRPFDNVPQALAVESRETEIEKMLRRDGHVRIAAELSRFLRVIEEFCHAAMILPHAGMVDGAADLREAAALRRGEPKRRDRLVAQEQFDEMLAEIRKRRAQIPAAFDLRRIEQTEDLLALLLDDSDEELFLGLEVA